MNSVWFDFIQWWTRTFRRKLVPVSVWTFHLLSFPPVSNIQNNPVKAPVKVWAPYFFAGFKSHEGSRGARPHSLLWEVIPTTPLGLSATSCFPFPTAGEIRSVVGIHQWDVTSWHLPGNPAPKSLLVPPLCPTHTPVARVISVASPWGQHAAPSNQSSSLSTPSRLTRAVQDEPPCLPLLLPPPLFCPSLFTCSHPYSIFPLPLPRQPPLCHHGRRHFLSSFIASTLNPILTLPE